MIDAQVLIVAPSEKNRGVSNQRREREGKNRRHARGVMAGLIIEEENLSFFKGHVACILDLLVRESPCLESTKVVASEHV